MADKKAVSQRIFVGFMAFLFLATALATGIAVIVSSVSNHKSSTGSGTTTTTTAKTSNTTKLAGTKLVGFTPVSSVPALQITDTKVGTGAEAQAGDTVSVQYIGAVASTGVIFQASTDTSSAAIPISLSDVITGWQKGIPGMKVGGVRQLVIPPAEAYGSDPPANSGIPVNAPLVFDITLLGVKQ
jgi:FKBP-type peptidyl-prolyl cis-trans isomerase